MAAQRPTPVVNVRDVKATRIVIKHRCLARGDARVPTAAAFVPAAKPIRTAMCLL